MTDAVPLRENLFRETAGGPVLLGSKNRYTGEIVFPALNSGELFGENFDLIELSGSGELFCESLVTMPTANFTPPYTVGYVKLPEGPLVFTPLRPVEGKPFRVGMKMRLEVLPLWSETVVVEKGRKGEPDVTREQQVIAYRFYPE